MTSPAITPQGKRLIELGALISDLELLDGPSREMDARIGHLLDLRADDFGDVSFRGYVDAFGGDFKRIGAFLNRGQSFWATELPHYTASIDAAIALAERVLQGKWTWSHSQDDQASWWSEARKGYQTSFEFAVIGRHQSLAIAVLIATLTALDKEG